MLRILTEGFGQNDNCIVDSNVISNKFKLKSLKLSFFWKSFVCVLARPGS